MKLKLGIYIGILALLLTAATGWRMHPVEPEGSELYERYKDMPGVRVGFVKDFPINDSLTCDVTTFEALTDEGWQWMLDSLCLQKAVAMAAAGDSAYRALGEPVWDRSNIIDYWQTKRFHPEVRGGSYELGDSVDYHITSLHYRWLTVYHATSDEEISAIVSYCFDYQLEHPMTMMPTKGNTI